MGSVMNVLRGLGVPEGRIKSEAFVYGANAEATATPVQTPTELLEVTAFSPQTGTTEAVAEGEVPSVTFSVSGKIARLLPSQTILEAGEAAGLELEYECRSGVCGSCKKRMLDGSVTMQVEDALTPMDKADRMILLCKARATERVTVEA
jgi:ferredoxin